MKCLGNAKYENLINYHTAIKNYLSTFSYKIQEIIGMDFKPFTLKAHDAKLFSEVIRRIPKLS